MILLTVAAVSIVQPTALARLGAGITEVVTGPAVAQAGVVGYRSGMSSAPRSPVFHAEAEDQEMARAAKRAVGSFKYLWRELTWEYRRILPALELSAIKAAFNDSDDGPVEHMWLSDIEFDGDVIVAKLMNSPNDLTSVKEGDAITLGKDQIEDWMYVMGGLVYGGFTVQVLRARMSPAERRAHDEAWGFTFAEPSRVDLVPNWQERGKKSYLGRLFGGGAPPPGDPDAEHPMSENMAKGLAEEVGKNRAAFFALGDAGLNALHSLALGGSLAGVNVLLEAGADPHARTRSGRTALELATMMGWPRVVELLRAAKGVG